MSNEADAIANVGTPATVASLRAGLAELGLAPGDTAIVHSSMSALGWVAGGPQAVVEALIDAVGPTGTIVMPTQSGQLSDPAQWGDPPVPAEWVPILHRELPAYDPYLTPTRGMGQIVECFRQDRSTIRSPHPTLSFAARGPKAETIVGEHPLTPAFGETSPLARLYEADAKILLLGVGHANNTSLHLSEHRATWAAKAPSDMGVPMIVDGERRWVDYVDLDGDESDFAKIGEAFATTGRQQNGRVGAGSATLMSQRSAVDFAATWMTKHR